MSSPFIIIDEIGKKITELKSDIVNKLNDTTSDIINNSIGADNATGGTSSAGTVMAKLNKIISDLSGIATSASNANTNALSAANRSFVKSVQRSSQSIQTNGGETSRSATVNISSVNTSKSILIYRIVKGTSDINPDLAYARLTSSTQISITYTDGFYSNRYFTIEYQVIEFY